jgi:hypothetical protein
MVPRDVAWQSIMSCAGLLVQIMAASSQTQFTSFNDRKASMLEGNWQSCRESDGTYGERIYDGTLPGIGPFELHLGPYHQFALFRGVQQDHRDHTGADNLLRPSTVDIVGNFGRQTWNVTGLRLDVELAGGSRDECESWWVQLRRAETGSH